MLHSSSTWKEDGITHGFMFDGGFLSFFSAVNTRNQSPVDVFLYHQLAVVEVG